MADDLLKIKNVKKKRYSQDCFVNFTNGKSEVIAMDLALKYNLSKNRKLSENELNKILAENRKIKVKQVAYKYANYKPRTEQQIIQKLKQKEFNDTEISIAIRFLKEFNLIDDDKYAENFLNELIKRKPSGKKVIKAELRKKGIDSDLADMTLDNYFPIDEVNDMAIQAAEKKMRIIRHKPEEKQKQSLINFLQRRGFTWETIKSILPLFFPTDR